jgi:hypothetical protein
MHDSVEGRERSLRCARDVGEKLPPPYEEEPPPSYYQAAAVRRPSALLFFPSQGQMQQGGARLELALAPSDNQQPPSYEEPVGYEQPSCGPPGGPPIP